MFKKSELFIDHDTACLVQVADSKTVGPLGERVEFHICSSAHGGAVHYRIVKISSKEAMEEKPMDPNEEICVIKWTLQDLVCAFKSENIEPTEEALSAVIDHIKGDLADLCIERGWQVIEDAIARKPWLDKE